MKTRFSSADVDDMFYTCTTFFAHRWQLSIIICLFDGPKHFGELLRSHEGLSPKMLSAILQKLEEKGIVSNTVYDSGQVTRSLYTLTEKGLELEPILDSIYDWGSKHAPARTSADGSIADTQSTSPEQNATTNASIN